MSTPVSVANAAGPVTETERIASIDVLRGFGVLGILVMNIQSFAMIGAAYLNPTAYGDLSGANYAVWLLSHLLADHKFMPIFSMLFGAGIVLMAERREATDRPATGVHYRRMGLLLVFGLLHAHLFWYGDILFHYAVCGMVVYWFRRRRPATLLVLGVLVFSVGSAMWLFFNWSMQYWPAESIDELRSFWQPGEEPIRRELAAYRGGWLEQMSERVPSALFAETFLLLVDFAWDAGGLMLIGMGLFKLGVFSARRSSAFYASLIAAGVFVGMPVILYGVHYNFAHEWDLQACFYHGRVFNHWASLLVSLGWLGLVMLVSKHGLLPRLTTALAAAGRLALTNYLAETILATTIFYGHGLGLFGKVERIGQIGIVVGIWIVLLVGSTLWVRRFRFGPFEWLWRTLTYMKIQPIRRQPDRGAA